MDGGCGIIYGTFEFCWKYEYQKWYSLDCHCDVATRSLQYLKLMLRVLIE